MEGNYLTPAFDNEGTFNVTFDVYSTNPEFYEAWNMLNYTNNGTMLADSAFRSRGRFVGGSYCSPGCGFQFDLHTTNGPHLMAGTFYNAGTIRCNSLAGFHTVGVKSAIWANASFRRPMSSLRAWSKSARWG